MKKLFAVILAAALVMSLSVTAFAANTTGGDADITTSINPTYTVTIPANTTVAFNATETDFGAIEVTASQIHPDKCIKVELTSDGKLENSIEEGNVMSKNDSQIVISKKTLIVTLIVLLLLVVGAVTVALNWNTWFGDKSAGPSAPQTVNFDIDENAASWNGQQLPDKTTEPPAVGIKIPGYPSITLPANQQTVNMALLNPEGNPCYFTFEIVLKDSGESLYKSKLVPPGQAITEVTLSRALSAGEYEATIQITTTSVEDGSAMNGANVETVLTVK